jgi:purine-nucleoside phosphorylase
MAEEDMISAALRQRVGVAHAETPRVGTMRDAAAEAARRVLDAGGHPAAVAAILGTGLGGLADRLASARVFDAAATRWLPRSTATGHAGRIVCGRMAAMPVIVLQGRVHAYEGFGPEVLRRGVELLAALGVRRLLVTNAAGGLEPDMVGGELVVLTDHIDLVRGAWAGLRGAAQQPYDDALAERALGATRRAGVTARKGVYAFVRGPSYETRAEYRMLRRFGADVVGMSTVPEVTAAAALGMEVAAVSVVTNVARPDAPGRTDAEDVCRTAGTAAEGVWAILEALLPI